ncbi:MAG: hypothetical protein ACO4AJ_09230 [Prochlorothrix sp.]
MPASSRVGVVRRLLRSWLNGADLFGSKYDSKGNRAALGLGLCCHPDRLRCAP